MDAIQVEMQKDVRKDEVSQTNVSFCADAKTDNTKLIKFLPQAYEEFAEKLGEAIFNFYTHHYNI